MSESASHLSFCNSRATAQEISSPPGVCLTISFPLPFPFPFPFPSTFPFPFQYIVHLAFPVPFSLLCMSSSPSLSSLSLPSLGRLLPQLCTPGSTQFSSSSSLSIISSRFGCLTARKWPSLYCWQLGGSIFALRSSLPYQERCSLVHLTFPGLVVCGLEQSTWSPKAWGLSRLELFI